MTAHCRKLFLVLAMFSWVPIQAQQLLGTYTVNYRWNTGGCSFSDTNPYHCAGSPGPIYVTSAPGKYKAVVTRLGPNPNGLARMWDGDSSKGTVYELPQGANVSFDHTFGQIVLYYWDWAPEDNPTDVWTEVQLYRVGSLAPPTISSLSPSSATAGGTGFTLGVTGSGLVSGSTVRWNGSALTTTFVSSTQLNAAVPAAQIGSAGNATITVANPDGSVSNSVTFTVTEPTPIISSLSPPSVTAGGSGFTLTVTGGSFLSGATVRWTGSSLTTTYVSTTVLTAAVPAALILAAGNAAIMVANPGGATSAPMTFTISAPAAPTITGLNPSSVTAGGAGFTLGVTGTGFVSGSTVRWNGSALTTAFLSSTQLNAAVPAAQIATAGNLIIRVINPDGTVSNSWILTITEPPPTLLGTYQISYRTNTAGCSFSDPNPYHCVGSPGPIYLTAAPGKYKVVVTRLGPNPNGLARMWDGDSSKGTVYELPQVHPAGASTDWNVVFTGVASVNATPAAAAGPLFVTRCV